MKNRNKHHSLLLHALKRMIDAGEEILTLKHVYDLSEEEMRELIDLCADDKPKKIGDLL